MNTRSSAPVVYVNKCDKYLWIILRDARLRGVHDSILGRRREEDVIPPVMTASRVPPVHPRALLETKPPLVAMQLEAKIRYRQREGAQNRITASNIRGANGGAFVVRAQP